MLKRLALSDFTHQEPAAAPLKLVVARPALVKLQTAPTKIETPPGVENAPAAPSAHPIISFLKCLGRGLSSALSGYASDSAAARVMPFKLIMHHDDEGLNGRRRPYDR